jgi:hypothetical protein
LDSEILWKMVGLTYPIPDVPDRQLWVQSRSVAIRPDLVVPISLPRKVAGDFRPGAAIGTPEMAARKPPFGQAPWHYFPLLRSYIWFSSAEGFPHNRVMRRAILESAPYCKLLLC